MVYVPTNIRAERPHPTPFRSSSLYAPMRWSAAVGTGLVLSLGTLAPAATAAGTTPVASSATATTATASIASHLPADWQSRSNAAAARFGIESPAREALSRVINPEDYTCGPTDFDTYIDGILAGLTTDELSFVFDVIDMPTYDALIFGKTSDARYALTSHAQAISTAFRDARRFWDVKSADIQLMAMHGSVLQDAARLTRLLNVVYGVSVADAPSVADYIVNTVAKIPELDGGDNPIFTLNAFAFSGAGNPDPFVSSIPDKLIFGDGILDALEAMGIGDVGPRAVLGHEFGHHVQYEDNLFESTLTGP